MGEFQVAKSVRMYFQEAQIKAAVDALLDKLDGKDIPVDLCRKEARDYNWALLMAARVHGAQDHAAVKRPPILSSSSGSRS